ncbi:MAG: hypothetical protein DRJ57_04325 [Thermoprotei archaeon]|nr:MAG: hypothetical protein DRJ57_04325 [Thermoprotei archaeon]
MFRPLEEVDLREGEEVELIIRRSVTAGGGGQAPHARRLPAPIPPPATAHVRGA